MAPGKNPTQPTAPLPALAALSPEDWRSSSNAELARKTGCAYATVLARRNSLIRQETKAGRTGDAYRCSQPRIRNPRIQELPPDITGLDWRNLSNSMLAVKLGLRYSDVFSIRYKLIRMEKQAGRSGGIYQYTRTGKTRTMDPGIAARITPHHWQNLSNPKIASSFGCSLMLARARRRQLIREEQEAGRSGHQYIFQRGSRPHAKPSDLAKIPLADWAKRTNHSIAVKLRCKISDVRNKRQQLIDAARKNGGTGREFKYRRSK